MAIKGTFDQTPPSQVLNLIGLAKQSGILYIYDESPDDVLIELGFNKGRLLYADSKEISGDLIHVLRKAGKINDRQLELIQQTRLGKTEKSLAIALINGNFVDRAAIMHCFEHHVIEVVFDLLTWRSGTYEFQQTAPPPDRVTVDISITDVIDESKRRSLELHNLEDMLPDLSLPLRLLEDNIRRKRLSDQEMNVISFVTETRSIASIGRACFMTDGEIRRVVLALIEKNVVEVVTPDDPPLNS